jgi:hypothetical protein
VPRPIQKLSQIQIGRTVKRQCTLNDGGRLYFVSCPPNGASWMFRFSRDGKIDGWGADNFPGPPETVNGGPAVMGAGGSSASADGWPAATKG